MRTGDDPAEVYDPDSAQGSAWCRFLRHSCYPLRIQGRGASYAAVIGSPFSEVDFLPSIPTGTSPTSVVR